MFAADPLAEVPPRVLPFPFPPPTCTHFLLSSELCDLLLAAPDPASTSNCTHPVSPHVPEYLFVYLIPLSRTRELTSPVTIQARVFGRSAQKEAIAPSSHRHLSRSVSPPSALYQNGHHLLLSALAASPPRELASSPAAPIRHPNCASHLATLTTVHHSWC